ncbi:MAG: [citrate (pro-3S)-lyase] ligase [Sphaerochaetaceae bacterium]|nr:[citrate (pro-3S)-lyase] ligase [Sphaerochaetaceae bacterium]
MKQVDSLLLAEGLRRDGNLDCTAVVYDENFHVIATGSAFGNTLRCFAVNAEHRGEGLLNILVNHLVEMEVKRGITHLFLYTKPESAGFFSDLGFYEITRVDNSLVFMENKRNGFFSFIEALKQTVTTDKPSACVVINANPFTKGHKYLIEQAASFCDSVHIFAVSEDKSVFPFAIRKKLIAEGISGMKGLILHETGPYLISNATFPTYFFKDDDSAILSQAKLDASVFGKIAEALGIKYRFLGDEPANRVTAVYNEVLSSELPEYDVEVHIIPRLCVDGVPVSASKVRDAVRNDNYSVLENFLPESTLSFLKSGSSQRFHLLC